jgi:hypothetical protein
VALARYDARCTVWEAYAVWRMHETSHCRVNTTQTAAETARKRRQASSSAR